MTSSLSLEKGNREREEKTTGEERANRHSKLMWLLAANTLVLLLVVYLLLRTIGVISKQHDLTTPEVVLVGVLIVLVANAYALSEFSVGPGGVKATLGQIKEDQDHMKENVEALRVAITGLLTKYERIHLKNLKVMPSYQVSYKESMYRELDNLLKIEYLEEVQPGALKQMKDDHEHSVQEYSLNQYLTVTTLGSQYLAVHAKYAGE
ncbi:hypothetical protein ACFZA1_05905 [Streptomyces filipinensis]|uniref:hypothetical protein n=1 Tax=Streptomyces filipinensis TaxID=66887 RepID=UPI0036E6CBD4